MTVTIYPTGDSFFSEGMTHLFSGKTPYEELLVLNLAKWSLKEIVATNWVERKRMQPTLIITESSLAPIANYLRACRGNTCVLDSSQLILTDLFHGPVVSDRLSSFIGKSSSQLTANEYRTLKCFFNLMTVDEEAFRYNFSRKTIYGVRSRLAAKLGVRRLTEILIW